MKFKLLILALSAILFSCNQTQNTEPVETVKVETSKTTTFQNKGHELVFNMVQKVGSYKDLLNKKDVVYTYTYQTPDGKTDQSTEKYIFNGELSHGTYIQHQRTFPQLEGSFEQGYDGEEFWLKHGDSLINDPKLLKRVRFNRKTNFYWFAMIQKLLDPGIEYEHLGTQSIENQNYEVVKISFASEDDKPTDIYQIYINTETGIMDQFLFTVADFNVMETPFLMKLQYEEVQGILIPNQRQYKKSTWDAQVSDAPWIQVTWSDIVFSNGLDKNAFSQK